MSRHHQPTKPNKALVLTDEEADRIRLEEHYRYEIRQRLCTDKQPSRLWAFLNSSFGMWILSAIVLSGLGSLYTKHREQHETQEREQQAVERLDLEIGYRFSQVQVFLYETSRLKIPDQERESKVRIALLGLTKPPTTTSDFQHLFPEYSTFGLPALIAELRRLESDPEHIDSLRGVMPHLAGLEVFFEVQDAPLTNPTKVAGAIIDKLVLGRWERLWYFLDGSKDDPFR